MAFFCVSQWPWRPWRPWRPWPPWIYRWSSHRLSAQSRMLHSLPAPETWIQLGSTVGTPLAMLEMLATIYEDEMRWYTYISYILDQPKLTPETLTVHSDERKNDREINQCWPFRYWPSNFFRGECLQKFAETSVEDFLNWKFCKRKSTSLDHTLGDSPLRIATMVPDLS